MTPRAVVLNEPELEFRYAQRIVDPKAGLSLFGPYDADRPGRPTNLSYVLIGTPSGVSAFREFAQRLEGPIVSVPYDEPCKASKDALLWMPYPGFEAAFGTKLATSPSWMRFLSDDALTRAARLADGYDRAGAVVDPYVGAIGDAVARDERCDVAICVVPDEVYENCRPESVVVHAEGTRLTRTERQTRRVQRDMFESYSPETYERSLDFRRQLKARAMAHELPIQIVRESTLCLKDDANSRSLTPLSDRAWNLSTTAYYKAGGKPWRLATAREGVCYVGIAFRRSEHSAGTACCAAQMFLDSGDGVVFRGEFGPWYSPRDKSCHLSAQAAEGLLRGVLERYAQQGGKELAEVFLHSRSTLDDEEMHGYRKACPPGVKLVGTRVRTATRELRLYRAARWPVLRGTLWVATERTAFLFASGFKQSLATYDGWDVPMPIRIDIEHGEADIEQVATDILGLTKLNYNACRLGDREPVTVGFSDAVGEILVSNPKERARHQFRYYI
jgi:hypothetical protein